MIFKEGVTEPVQCEKVIEGHQTIRDQQEAYRKHIEIHKMNGTYVSTNGEPKPFSGAKGARMKDTHCPKWINNQMFESFHRDFTSWQQCSDLTNQQEKNFLVEMLKGCEREPMLKNIMQTLL